MMLLMGAIPILFLSTLSLRRATKYLHVWYTIVVNFYPRSPCGERPTRTDTVNSFGDFYPRSPCGERRYWPCVHVVGCPISIHALLAESDGVMAVPITPTYEFLSTLSLRRATGVPSFYNNRCQNFYPRSPCGERLVGDVWACRWPDISIHALLAESDIRNAEAVSKYMIFLSTLSLRRATRCRCRPVSRDRNFYPRSPCGERQITVK